MHLYPHGSLFFSGFPLVMGFGLRLLDQNGEQAVQIQLA